MSSINNILTTTTGLDDAIQAVQTDLYDYFSTVWSGDMSAYGRVHKNPANVGEKVPDYYRTSKIVTPEWYNMAKNDYEEVYYNDRFASTFCFLVGDKDKTEDGLVFVSKVKCVFMVNLTEIFPNISGRQDAKAQNDVANFLRDNSFERFQVTGIERGLDTIFQEYKTSNIRTIDMQPLHCFSVNLDLAYYLKC